jgi:hypothetical protein
MSIFKVLVAQVKAAIISLRRTCLRESCPTCVSRPLASVGLAAWCYGKQGR